MPAKPTRTKSLTPKPQPAPSVTDRIVAAVPGRWIATTATGNVLIVNVSSAAVYRVHNIGEQEARVVNKEGAILATLKRLTACDVEGNHLTISSADANGTYERL